jgi:FixJ family two-component response regulator
MNPGDRRRHAPADPASEAPRDLPAAPPAVADSLVYVVDDDDSVRRALARLIRSMGLRVETFPSAEAFLAHERADLPSCLILDVRLPGPSGLDLQATLAPAQSTLPIIFITGHGTVPTSVRAMKGGAIDFLQKPFDDQELIDGIRRALSRSRAARAEGTRRAAIQRRLAGLTPREREVLRLVVAGRVNKRIAADLGAAEKTIKVHRGRVMKKMEAESVADLVRMMHQIGLETTPP